jgi:hypothetical protein
MREFQLQLAASAMLISSPVSLPTAASAQSQNELMNLCKELSGPNPQPQNEGTIGECSSLFILFGLEADGLPTHVCDLWQDRGQLGDNGYDNFAQCVRGEHSFFNE